ncbi:MAG: alpha/beta fold hydrolase [Candidatus Thorarchaeota archaeon]
MGDIELAYDTFGDPSSPPMLLIMGLGSQMIRWDEAFCQAIAAQGRWVIRFDNRDVGLSTKLDYAGVPNAMALLQGQSVDVPYNLKDMADDAIGLLDSLKIKAADVVGVSMGGMIAQTMAIHYPARVRTLTSIMSSTGNPSLPRPKPEAAALLVTPPVSNLDDFINNSLKSQRILHGPKYTLDEDYVRHWAEQSYNRCYHPKGFARQLGAVITSGSRHEELKNVKIPTLVIHGDADPLVPIEGGKDTAKSIPGARLIIFEGMGHSFPTEIAPKIIKEILQHTAPK